MTRAKSPVAKKFLVKEAEYDSGEAILKELAAMTELDWWCFIPPMVIVTIPFCFFYALSLVRRARKYAKQQPGKKPARKE